MSATTDPMKNGLYKGIEQAVDPGAFDHVQADEFPQRSSLPDIDRRSLLKFAGTAAVMAGLSGGCRFLTPQKIVPYVNAPEGNVPGKDRWYATALDRGGYGTGVLVRSTEGRPIKIEGNPNHPSSMGASDPMTTAEISVLYDPDRLSFSKHMGTPATWPSFVDEALEKLANGQGVALLTPNIGSPTLAGAVQKFLAKHKGAQWFQYEAANRDQVREGAIVAFGQPVETVYSFDKADVVVTLDADFLAGMPGSVRYARDFSQKRAINEASPTMSRVYAIEHAPTLVGAAADHRFRAKPTEMAAIAQALAAAVGVPGATTAANPLGDKAIGAIADDLNSNRGRAVVVPGEHQDKAVHALAHAINQQIGAVGSTVTYRKPVLADWQNNNGQISELSTLMKSGELRALFILGGNPAYDAPRDLEFASLIEKVPFVAHLTMYDNETSQACGWVLPMSHPLECWGDAKGHDGTTAIGQPLIKPLYDTKSSTEFLMELCSADPDDEHTLRAHWGLSSDAWATALSNGVIGGPHPAVTVSPMPNVAGSVSAKAGSGFDLVILPDPTILDGRYSNVGWLQELPKPITNLTWDNTFQMSPATAEKLGLNRPQKMLGVVPYYGNADLATVTVGGTSVTGPVYVNMGMADDTVVVHMGYGRSNAGQIGNVGDSIKQGGGFDSMPLRRSDSPWIATGVQVAKAAGSYKLANAQYHNLLDVTTVDSGRDVIREVTLAELQAHPEALEHPTEGEGAVHESADPTALYDKDPRFYDPKTNYQWAMTIDLNLCTGCNACVTACQSENNIPTVGKEQVLRGREMHWLRIDRYYRPRKGKFDPDSPVITLQPLTCMQCEKAPCEPVCPVAATTHSHEGLNQMVYNRCVGTRYCSNNCPYKVRRFNFLHFTSKPEQVPVLKMLQNPDVTVRGRGVMEKCTYCVHRINHARIDAKLGKRPIEDGEVVTACQQACPTNAIVFGDMGKPENMVSKSRSSKRNYVLLEPLNTVPRTSYLGKVRNPNPELEA